jgi:ANTAR domain/GAF domain
MPIATGFLFRDRRPAGCRSEGCVVSSADGGAEGRTSGGDPAAEGSTGLDRAYSDQVDLSTALAGLAGIVTGTASLNGLLEQVAQFAVAAIPGAQGVGVTLLEAGRADTVVASADFVRAVDDIQYSFMEGPCVTAATERRTVRSGLLAQDPLWPRFGPRVGQLGVQSALSLPLVVGADVVGAMNVYAWERDVFDQRATELGELFAGPAAVAVRNAQVLEQARRLTEQLQTALSSRAVIDQALGILMSRRGGTAGEAFESLRWMSQHNNVRLNAVAQEIVDEAVRRARARRTHPDAGPGGIR